MMWFFTFLRLPNNNKKVLKNSSKWRALIVCERFIGFDVAKPKIAFMPSFTKNNWFNLSIKSFKSNFQVSTWWLRKKIQKKAFFCHLNGCRSKETTLWNVAINSKWFKIFKPRLFRETVTGYTKSHQKL